MRRRGMCAALAVFAAAAVAPRASALPWIFYQAFEGRGYVFAEYPVTSLRSVDGGKAILIGTDGKCFIAETSLLASPTLSDHTADASFPSVLCQAGDGGLDDRIIGYGGGRAFEADTSGRLPNLGGPRRGSRGDESFKSARGYGPRRPTAATVLRIAADGNALAIGDKSGTVWVDPFPEDNPRPMDEFPAPVADLRFSNDGGRLFGRDVHGELRAWDWQAERAEDPPFDVQVKTWAIATAAKAPLLARWADGGKVEVFDLVKNKVVRVLALPDDRPDVFELDPAGRRLAVGKGARLAFWDLNASRRLGVFSRPLTRATAFLFLPDGKTGVVGEQSGLVQAVRLSGDIAGEPAEPETDEDGPPRTTWMFGQRSAIVDARGFARRPSREEAAPPPATGTSGRPPQPPPVPLSEVDFSRPQVPH